MLCVWTASSEVARGVKWLALGRVVDIARQFFWAGGISG